MSRIAAIAAACLAATPAGAQTVVKVAQIESARDCALYETYGGALVSQCRDQFPELRDRIQSALLESGRLALSTRHGGRDTPAPNLVLSGRVTALGIEDTGSGDAGYCVAARRLKGSMDVRVRDARSGQVLFGGTITRSIEAASALVAGGEACSLPAASGRNLAPLQRELALSAARLVSFYNSPMRVARVDGGRLVLNYGSPLVPLGAVILVAGRDGAPARYRVSMATPATATAEAMGSAVDVAPGAIATVLESDDPVSTGRRYERVALP